MKHLEELNSLSFSKIRNSHPLKMNVRSAHRRRIDLARQTQKHRPRRCLAGCGSGADPALRAKFVEIAEDADRKVGSGSKSWYIGLRAYVCYTMAEHGRRSFPHKHDHRSPFTDRYRRRSAFETEGIEGSEAMGNYNISD